MLPYWFLFSICSAFATGAELIRRSGQPAFLYAFFLAALIVLGIGLRFEIGVDWLVYIMHFNRTGYLPFSSVLSLGDPGYYLLNWLMFNLGLGIWAVNLVCAGLFAWGLFAFAARTPHPPLAITVAIPYLVIVVAMGYPRQGVAIGLTMLALSYLLKGSMARFVLWMIIAVTFHKSAVVVLPLVALSRTRNRIPTLIASVAMVVILYLLFLEGALDRVMKVYIDAEYDSDGALIRIAMNVAPAVALFLLGKRFGMDPSEWKLWRNFAIAALVSLPAYFLLPSSTFLDRIALYIIPLQIFVLASLPWAMGHQRKHSGLVLTGVLLYAGAVQFVWLNFATDAQSWIPYKFYPFETLE